MSKPKREWSNSDIRSLVQGEFHNYFGQSLHNYQKSDWFVWFLSNSTRYAIFFLFLQKYGKGEMVSYTDLTQTKKIGRVNLKIDSIKATIRDGLELGFLQSFKSDDDRRVTLYDFNPRIIHEVADYCFCMRRNRMIETASYIHSETTLKVSKELENAVTDEWAEAVSSTVDAVSGVLESKFGVTNLKNITPISKKKKQVDK
jgi:hypothetical protein